MEEVRKSAVLAARALIEKDPAYSYVTARLLLDTIRLEVLGEEASQAEMETRYATYFPQFIEQGIAAELLDPELGNSIWQKLGRALERAARPAVRLPRPADAVRPLLPARAAAGASSCRRPSSCASRWASR